MCIDLLVGCLFVVVRISLLPIAMPRWSIFGRWRSTARDSRPSRVARASEVPPAEMPVEERRPEEIDPAYVCPGMMPEMGQDRP